VQILDCKSCIGGVATLIEWEEQGVFVVEEPAIIAVRAGEELVVRLNEGEALSGAEVGWPGFWREWRMVKYFDNIFSSLWVWGGR
jgi:hypothetical protein